jgi:hypothetical protein
MCPRHIEAATVAWRRLPEVTALTRGGGLPAFPSSAPWRYGSGMSRRFVRPAGRFLSTILAIVAFGVAPEPIAAEAHAGHHQARPAAPGARHADAPPADTPAAFSPRTTIHADCSGDDCCSDCPSHACTAAGGCGGSTVAGRADALSLCRPAVARSGRRARAPPPGSLARTPLTPPPQLVA